MKNATSNQGLLHGRYHSPSSRPRVFDNDIRLEYIEYACFSAQIMWPVSIDFIIAALPFRIPALLNLLSRPLKMAGFPTFLDQHSFLPYPAALTASSLHIWALLPDSEDLFVCDLPFPYLHKYNQSPTRSRTTPAAPTSISAVEWRRNIVMAFMVECLAKDVTVPSAR